MMRIVHMSKIWCLHFSCAFSHPDGIKYLIVLSPERFHGDLAPADIVGLADGWETLKNSGRTIGEDVISEMAQTHRMLGGKWMMYPRTRTLSDMFWSVIAPAVVSGKLTESCVAAKISGPGTNRRSTLCVYMNDFTNFEKIKELERAIRALKFKCDMRFKADIYSQLGIYGPNCGDYNVHDRLYESHFVLSLEEEHRSMIIRPWSSAYSWHLKIIFSIVLDQIKATLSAFCPALHSTR